MLKLNILKNHKHTPYAEIPQANPLLWQILHKKVDVLTSQSSRLKCKDFFNDVVAWKVAKKKFSIYGFSNEVKFNRNGLWVHLTEIAKKERFKANLAIVDARLQADLKCNMTYQDTEDGLALLVPPAVWKSTYYISLLSMVIRCCNYDKEYKTWEEIFAADSPMAMVDGAFNLKAREYTCKNGFILPKAVSHMWYNAGHGWNSDTKAKEATGSIVHNNGVCSWIGAMGV
jgi:hypothetical protein